MNAIEGRDLFVKLLEKNSKIIDVGSGPEESHAKYFRDFKHTVDVCDFHSNARYCGDFNKIKITEIYDAVWSSHCLEHQPNVYNYLRKIHSILKEEGLLCITVPPLKSYIVGGHLTLWNAGLLLLNLVTAGFNCKKAKIRTYGYNISVIVRKNTIEPLPSIPEIQILNNIKEYFPEKINWKENHIHGVFQGQIQSLDWSDKFE